MNVQFGSLKRNERFASITPDFHRELSCGLLQLRLIRSCDWIEFRWILSRAWLEFRRLDMSCGWFYPMAHSSSGRRTQLVADLYFNMSNKFKDLLCKIHHFYGLFPSGWFQLPLIQALVAASRTLKKLQEAWRSFTTLAATDSSCSSWFETCDQFTTTRILTPITPDNLNWLDKMFNKEII